MVVQDEQTGFLLKCTDEAVNIVQSLVTLLSSFYESAIDSEGGGSSMMLGALNTESVEDLHKMLNELLAKLWPCEKRFVAVIGPTGCGKSTLLNLLTCMTCKTGEEYQKGIKLDESRAVLRDTVVEHGVGLKNHVDHGEDNQMEGNDDSLGHPRSALQLEELLSLNFHAEKMAMCGLLGFCCHKDRDAYLAKHLALYDTYPFLLQNGRMGDAGTTKVTAVQWGPKFAARIQWVDKRKLRKRWRELRSFLDNAQPAKPTEADTPLDPYVWKAKESKELWESMLRLVDYPLHLERLPTPTEELIDSTLKELGKKVPLGRNENIQTSSTRGCIVDRVYVRDAIRKRLCEEKLGLLSEDLVIEVPMPSSEGGVSLLDVPGTNDPRLLHQRETRDAIDRTTLILLILDKSVVDAGTLKVLEDSPVLERMLLDSSERCNLVVVGIAEKRCKSGQSATDTVAEFDPKQDLRKALKSVFLKKTRNLLSSRRLTKDEAKRRLDSIFVDNRLSVLPVLPLLCASLHLSASNPTLHRETCESSGSPTCPLVMNGEERMKKCLQTNVPQLLEMIQSVRVPSSRVQLKFHLESALSMLKMYTQESKYDQSMIEFFDRESKHAQRVAKQPIAVEKLLPDNTIDMDFVGNKLSSYAQNCILSPEDLEYVRLKIDGPDSRRASNTSIDQDIPPVLMRGFRPEVIGTIARELIQPTEDKASVFVSAVCQRIVDRMNGNVAWRDNHLDQVSTECLGSCVALLQDVQTQWKHTMERVLARRTWGGSDGGLQKRVRGTLRKAYDSTFKTAMVDMRKQRKSRKATTNELLTLLEHFEFGEKVKNAAFAEIEKHLHVFWEILLESIHETASKLWSDWICQLLFLKESTKQALNPDVEVASNTVRDLFCEQNLGVSIRDKISELENLLSRMESQEPLSGEGAVKYGYSLLQINPSYETELLKLTSGQKPKIIIPVSNPDEQPEIQTLQDTRRVSTTPGTQSKRETAVLLRGSRQAAASMPSPAGSSHASPRSKLGCPMRLHRRAVVTLPDSEAHDLQTTNHQQQIEKRRKK